MAEVDHAKVLTTIQEQQARKPLAIISLAEPILSNLQQKQSQQQKKEDDLANSVNDSSAYDASVTPAALVADLDHYKSLFSKLRFSYLEQVTKEKYLRSIVGDPPVLVSQEDNLALEEKLVGMKSELKAKKEDVNYLVEEMEALAKDLAQRYEIVNVGLSDLERLPHENEELEDQVAELKAKLKAREYEMDVDVTNDPRLNLGMQETEDLLEEQGRQMKEVDEQIAALQSTLPGKIRECERAERELEALETKKNEVTKQARELRRIREEGGRDMLEEQGRWYKSSEILLRGLLEIET